MHDEQNLDTRLVAVGPSVVIAAPIYRAYRQCSGC
jgi:hypothetical protein